MRQETAAQVDRRGESDPGGDGFHREVGLFRWQPCRVEAPAEQPLSRAGAELFGDTPGEGSAGQPGTFGEPDEGQWGVADWVARFVSALKISGPIAVAGHDIGGALAQHLLVHDRLEVSRLALVNSVTYDSWPAPHVARFRGPGDVEGTLIAAPGWPWRARPTAATPLISFPRCSGPRRPSR